MQLKIAEVTLDADRLTAKQARTLIARHRGNKYRNRRVTIDGQRFDSVKEAKTYKQLATLERAGVISNLKRQVRIPLIVNDVLVCTIVPDFTYTDESGRKVYIDAKGFATREWKTKAKLFAALHPGFQITTV
jgi:predicted nuclease of restriction endonuclease-like RecB superfamily